MSATYIIKMISDVWKWMVIVSNQTKIQSTFEEIKAERKGIEIMNKNWDETIEKNRNEKALALIQKEWEEMIENEREGRALMEKDWEESIENEREGKVLMEKDWEESMEEDLEKERSGKTLMENETPPKLPDNIRSLSEEECSRVDKIIELIKDEIVLLNLVPEQYFSWIRFDPPLPDDESIRYHITQRYANSNFKDVGLRWTKISEICLTKI